MYSPGFSPALHKDYLGVNSVQICSSVRVTDWIPAGVAHSSEEEPRAKVRALKKKKKKLKNKNKNKSKGHVLHLRQGVVRVHLCGAGPCSVVRVHLCGAGPCNEPE